jgi:hypothetical protein
MPKSKDIDRQGQEPLVADPDDVLRKLLAMPPQPKKGKAEKDRPATK